ncbi:MAG: DUF3307 domain-containing protein [Silicimonas sp.]|nr:DUF3307 domain-containing protein [Silicimonas sp.]
MLETFAALLFAHVLADFVLQTGGMVARKRAPLVLLLHAVLVLVTAQAALGRIDAWEVLALAAAHLAIDMVKTYALPPRLWAFLADQATHLVTLLVLAALAPDLFAGGIWAEARWLPDVMALAAGLIIATLAGGHAVALLVGPWADDKLLPEGLPNGGRLIGLLERGIIYLLILVGQPAGIGFLIAAKSVLRFETTSKDTRAGEYVIIGTLASFGWAMVPGWSIVWLNDHLPPLGSPRSLP